MPTPKYIHMVSGSRRTINRDDSVAFGNRIAYFTGSNQINPTVFQLDALDNLIGTARLPKNLDRLGSERYGSDGGSALTIDTTCSGGGAVTHDRSLELISTPGLRHHIRIGSLDSLGKGILTQINGDDYAGIGVIATLNLSSDSVLVIALDVEISLIVLAGENLINDLGNSRTVVIITLHLEISTMGRSLRLTLVGRQRNRSIRTAQVLGHIPIPRAERRSSLNGIIEELSIVGGNFRTGSRSLVNGLGRNRTQLKDRKSVV